MKKNILVTGCGSDIGQSIVHVLKKWIYLNKVIGTDINAENPSKFIYDHFILVPKCSSSEYKVTMQKIISQYSIDTIIVASESELRMITDSGIEGNYFNIPLIAVDLKTRKISFDKYDTAVFLRDNNFPHPFFFLTNENNNIKKYPIIFKSRYGASGKKVELIEDKDQLFNNIHFSDPEYFIQEYLPGENNEYTCCVYRNDAGEMDDIVFRRKLVDGFSIYGELVSNEAISNFIRKVAQNMNTIGSINLQLRMVEGIPMLFEINPRFSSTVEFRDEFGFKDLIWSLEDKFGLPKEKMKNTKLKYTKFYKAYTVFYE